MNGRKVYIFKDFYVSVNGNSTESYIHDEKRNVLKESAASSSNKVFPKFAINFKGKEVIELDEAVDLAIIYSYNYWHFTFTHLDKIVDFEENGFKGKYIVPNMKYIRELLCLTGIPMERFIYSDGTEKIFRVKKLHVLEYCYKVYPEIQVYTNPESVESLQKIKHLVLSHIDLSDINKYPKKIFVKRIGIRKINNESEVERFLSKYNFETIIPEEHSVEEQIKYFYAADVVFCAHGANSTNALYMRSNTHFLESFGDKYINPCMFDIIKRNKIHYHMLVGKTNNKSVGYTSDYPVSIEHLDCILYNLV